MASVKDPRGVEARALAALADFDGKRVLEIGCGDGRMTLLYAERAREVLGVDVEEESIREARAAACCSRASAAVAPESRSPFE